MGTDIRLIAGRGVPEAEVADLSAALSAQHQEEWEPLCGEASRMFNKSTSSRIGEKVVSYLRRGS